MGWISEWYVTSGLLAAGGSLPGSICTEDFSFSTPRANKKARETETARQIAPSLFMIFTATN
jgi:hypothetical protein